MTREPTISFDDFKARLAAAGFSPDAKALEEMYAALPYLEEMQARVRRGYGYGDEPATCYSAAAQSTGGGDEPKS